MGDSVGLIYYGARFYDPALGRWAQPDSVVSGLERSKVPVDPLAWDRYAYVNSNSLKYNDPSGHDADCAVTDDQCKKQVAHEKLICQPQLPAATTIQASPSGTSTNSNNGNTSTNKQQSEEKKSPTITDVLSDVRVTTGELDPFIPNELAGTNLNFWDAYGQSLEAFDMAFPPMKTGIPPVDNITTTIEVAGPFVCTGYDIIYDNLSNSGFYNTSPSQKAYLIIAIPIAIPAFIAAFAP